MEAFYKSYGSLPGISGTKISQGWASHAFLRIMLCSMVGRNGVLQAGIDVFDAKIILMVDSKTRSGGNTLKSLSKLFSIFRIITSFYRKSFKQRKNYAAISVPSYAHIHTHNSKQSDKEKSQLCSWCKGPGVSRAEIKYSDVVFIFFYLYLDSLVLCDDSLTHQIINNVLLKKKT